ncbi:MAG: FadR/GntR family transcriptional regulator [Lautropia sp.]
MNKPATIREQVMDDLGRRIIAGDFAENEPIPPETQLASDFGVSRIVVREAVKSLAAKGLVRSRQRTGTRIEPRTGWNLLDPQVLDWQAEHGLDDALIAELEELRRIIEPAAARLAAARATDAERHAIRSAYEQMAATLGNRDAYTVADLAFHGAILDACGNRFLQQLRGALSQVLTTSFRASLRNAEQSRAALALHRELLVAIEARDPDAADAAVGRLIDSAAHNLRRACKGRGVP